MPATEFEGVAALLGDAKRPIHCLGGRFTDAIAQYLAAHLRILRPGVHHLDGQPGNWRDGLLDIGRRDVVVFFDIRRYQDDLLVHAKAVRERGGTVVLVTDQWLSPIAQIATHVLPARIAVPSPWDSSAALMAIAEALIAAVTTRDWTKVKTRIGALETLRPGETE
jgi:DNA-binding MurR/RpiR family transcriptional regulator